MMLSYELNYTNCNLMLEKEERRKEIYKKIVLSLDNDDKSKLNIF